MVMPLPNVGLRQLLDVMHHAIQIPLRIDLGVASKIETVQGRNLYGLRKQTVEPVFGIIKSVRRCPERS